MSYFSFLSGKKCGESMEIQWMSDQFNGRFIMKIFEHYCVLCLISLTYLSFLSGNSSGESMGTSLAELPV